MPSSIPLDRMTTAEKLRALEEIWDDLSRSSEQVPAPPWHGDVLAERAANVKDGSAKFVRWSEVKRRLVDRTQ